jgi:hypothetical protein
MLESKDSHGKFAGEKCLSSWFLGLWPLEQQDVRFQFTDHIMDSSLSLLHAKIPIQIQTSNGF